MEKFSYKGVIVAIVWRAVAFYVGGSIFGLIAFEPNSYAGAPLPPGAQQDRVLTFADRVAYQYAIEEVYWRHRIWPKENPGPKPSLDGVMSRSQIGKMVEDYLRKSQDLEDQWQRPITPEQLQAEMDRMAGNTRQPDVLRELFAALGNDPFLIAECLARPILAERFYRPPGCPLLGSTSNSVRRPVAPSQSRYKLPEISVSLDCADDTWTATKGPISERSYNTTVWTGSEMIVWGGYNNGAYFNTGGKYNPSTDTWTPTSTTDAASARISHTAVWTGTEMIVWGGFDISVPGGATNTGGRYNPITDSWTTTNMTNVPSVRERHTAVWTGTEMIVWGGYDYNVIYSSAGGRYNPNTDSWTATSTTNSPIGREGHTALWIGTEMIVWGGINDRVFNATNTGGRYNPITDTWIATTTTGAPLARYSHAAVWTGSEMILWGGYNGNGTYFNSGGKYNPSANNWMPTSTTNAPTARAGHTAVWTGTKMIVWGGGNNSAHNLNTGGTYNPSTDVWTDTNTAGAPPGRSGHAAVWTGSEMIVWGGSFFDGFSYALNTGGRYNPDADTWVATNLNVPVSRSHHTAVWTGSEMIVWGGSDENHEFNSGGRYDPSTDNWTTTSTTNAPLMRDYHSAVWTGSEMIVWGGEPISNTGGRYNPISDSWVATSTTNAPDGRLSHTAVWTGSEMIVWGGDGGGDLNTGGRYNPISDSWVATSTTNAPAARANHTVVWTGSQMIVWGGYAGATGYNSGGRYNPSTDKWAPTSFTGAPDPRAYHTAVWTGSQMIVWGGSSNTGYLNTGGRYDPGTDSWIHTDTTEAPHGRGFHTAVWTGSEMIVWGGFYYDGNGHFLNTGARYSPSTDGWTATSTTDAPDARHNHTAVWTGSQMIVWGGYYSDGNYPYYLNSGGRYCVQASMPSLESAVSRKTHGAAGAFDVDLPLSGPPGIECRSGATTNDYATVVTFASNVTVTGSPQAQLTMGTGCVGTDGTCTGNVSVSGNIVTVPLTNIANAQTINVRINSVSNAGPADVPATDFDIPMSILICDTNASGTVNAADVAQTNGRLGQTIDATNFRSDIDTNASINAADTALARQNSGTSLPP